MLSAGSVAVRATQGDAAMNIMAAAHEMFGFMRSIFLYAGTNRIKFRGSVLSPARGSAPLNMSYKHRLIWRCFAFRLQNY